MKLLVLAQTPPPLHGQSVMVRTLVDGLPPRGIAVHHVNLRLSEDAADIGRWRIGKIVATIACAFRAIAAHFAHGCDTLYYVPAPPAKRGALYRDWLLMTLCRPFFRRLILHWHAAGLTAWLVREATSIERWISRLVLGRAAVAVVLAETLRRDAEFFAARRIVVVPNGIRDPGEPPQPPESGPFHVVFLALCSEDKGLFTAARAVLAANEKVGATNTASAFVFTAAGPFDNETTAVRWREFAAAHPQVLRHIGVVRDHEKRAFFAGCHALCLPTQYAAEALPLVALEALAHDRPVIATRWRGLPDIVTPEVGRLVSCHDEAELVAALLDLRENPPIAGACRARFLERYTVERHLSAVAAALETL